MITPVIVTTLTHEARHDWATSVSVVKRGRNRGMLQIYEGMRLRCTYKAGEWTKYTVACPPRIKQASGTKYTVACPPPEQGR